MLSKILITLALSLCVIGASAQNKISTDSLTNNLVLPDNYETAAYGEIPSFIKKGTGKQILILIPGLGFDASVFSDFMEANAKYYTMYAITIPGYGNTKAPQMPISETSYGQQYWNKGVLTGLMKLIEKEKLDKPFLVGHFVQGSQLALLFAVHYPGKVGGVITIGGPAKSIAIINGEPKEFSLKSTIFYVDNYTALKWFKTISKSSFDNGNYLPEVYSLIKDTANKLWRKSASVPLPVMVRYLCEFFASDITLEIDQIKCPVLVLRSTFNKKIFQEPINNYIQSQFINSWDDAAKKNPLIRITDIPNAATFAWKDNPDTVYSEIKKFLAAK